MASSSTFDAKVLMAEGRRATAAYIHSKCPQHLNAVLDRVFTPAKSITDKETIEWCKLLMAGGRTADEFASIVRSYDTQTKCGLVWTPNFVAYRCRTCCMSPCMSLCTDCFKKGNHHKHDFNMFLSQAGGACDCGDASVMKETGFCDRHGPNKSVNKGRKAPQDLMCEAEAMMPRIMFRLLQHFREHCNDEAPILEAADYITMLQDFNYMGALMRRVMTSALTNPQKYKDLNYVSLTSGNPYDMGMYNTALANMANPKPLDRYRGCRGLQEQLTHKTQLEELVFWTVYFEFPERLVCLLLNMLPDPDYKEALMRAIVLHYSRIALMLETAGDPEGVSNRVVHASVQLFSNKNLALKMTEQMNLLDVMVISLTNMMHKSLTANIIHDLDHVFHEVVDCRKPVMAAHCYWPMVSDLNNVLSHRLVALHFLNNDFLLKMWFCFLNMFQGMNLNHKETKEHIQFDPTTYFAAFSAELEACAYPMWALVSHLTDASTAHLTKKILAGCENKLSCWFKLINFIGFNALDKTEVTFHLPLHRYYSVFLCQGVAKQGIKLDDVLPSKETLGLMILHPLKVLVTFYEVLSGMWKRNGVQMTGQAMTYIQANFCNSMVDPDLYLIQVACTKLCPNTFISLLIESFNVTEFLSVAPEKPRNQYIEPDFYLRMLESMLLFMATLVTIRTNIGLSETEVNRLEMVTLLCLGDRTHSQLVELVPERCGSSPTKHFEALLTELADYRPPVLNDNTSSLQQGMYCLKPHVWENLYDPLYLMLRAVHRTDPNTAYNRYCAYAKNTKRFEPSFEPWLPFREPKNCLEAYQDPRLILKSRAFHAAALVILREAVQGQIPESTMALIIFLLDQTVTISKSRQPKDTKPVTSQRPVRDMSFKNWFATDCVFENLTTVIGKVTLTSQCDIASMVDLFDSEEIRENDSEMINLSEIIGDDDIQMIEVSNSENDKSVLELGSEERLNRRVANISDKFHQRLLPMSHPSNSSSVYHTQPSTSAASISSPFIPSGLAPPTSSVNQSSEDNASSSPTVELNESIISLLLKLHSQLSGVPNSYKPEEAERSDNEETIGDGPCFIGRLLRKISKADETCKRYIQTTRMRLWPPRKDEEVKKPAREVRKRRAAESRAKMLADMADKQKIFMETSMETDENAFDSDKEEVGEKVFSWKEYECIICNKCTPSYEVKPMGLVVLIESSNLAGHRRRNGPGVFPTCEQERVLLEHDVTLHQHFEKKLEDLNQHFRPESCYLSVGVGLESGSYVQTCGHYVHLECLNPYLRLINRSEYECPLCKTMSNAVLPIIPDINDCPQAKTIGPNMSRILYELRELLQDNDLNSNISPLTEAIGKIIGLMSDCTLLKPILNQRRDEPIFQGLSVARANLEIDLCQRGGTLVTNKSLDPRINKRDCIGHLLRMLTVHAREARASARWPAWTTFQQLRGMSPKPPSDVPIGPVGKELPLLLKDPIAVLLQFILLLPLNLDPNYFQTTVQMVYNLLYNQVVAQISCGLTASERTTASQGVNHGKICTLRDAMALVNQCLGHTDLYMNDDDPGQRQPEVDLVVLDLQVQKLCLPYLRIAALLKYHFYQIPLPEIPTPETEFICIVHYLELVKEPMDLNRFNAATALNWPTESQMHITSPLSWFTQYADFVEKDTRASRSLLMDQHITWSTPRLLELPNEYEKIFTYYHKRPCTLCKAVPKEATICLICGTVICLQQICCKQKSCKQKGICRAVAHSSICGAGIGIFLVVTSTYIVVIRGRQACSWGSLYLDEFAEEDKDLKRGKPLFLSRERFRLLQRHWLTHRFDNIKDTWMDPNQAF